MERNTYRTGGRWRSCAGVLLLTVVFLALSGAAFAATEDLDQNEEVQWVMGDLSALKTAAQTYYSDSGNTTPPSVPTVLSYFEPGSMPPNAVTLYALKGDSRGWYVGYLASGLKNETYRLLQSNAEVLGLLGDDLRTPWRYGSRYFWSEALALSPSAGTSTTATTTTTTVVKRDTDISDVTGLVLATAALVNIIADNDRDRYYYYVPGYNWYWHSGLVYRPVYYNRFFRYYYRPLPVPPPRFYSYPHYRYNVPRAGRPDPNWRRWYDDAHRRYNPRYEHDRRLDSRYPDRRWRNDGRPSLPPPPPPRREGLRPINPGFRENPPRMLPPGSRRPDGRRSPGMRRPDSPVPRSPSQPPRRPDGRRTPEMRRPDSRPSPVPRGPSQPPRRPDGRRTPEMRRPDSRPSPGSRSPSQPPRQGRPENVRQPRPENRRPQPPRGQERNPQFRH